MSAALVMCVGGGCNLLVVSRLMALPIACAIVIVMLPSEVMKLRATERNTSFFAN